MTAKQYVDEVKLRLSRIDVVLDLNDPLILSYVNKARREVQKATIDIIPERYGEIYTVNITRTLYTQGTVVNTYSGNDITVIGFPLPVDLIDVYATILMYKMNAGESYAPDVTFRSEARRMAKPEMYNVSMNAWNVPSAYRPVYSIERSSIVGAYGYWMYMSGFDIDTGVTLWDVANGITAEVWYTKALDDIETYNALAVTDSELVIPPDVEEIVIYYAMLYCLQNIKEADAVQSVMAELQQLVGVLGQNYMISEQRQLQMLPSKEGI